MKASIRLLVVTQLLFQSMLVLSAKADDALPADRLTPEEIEFVRNAKKEFEKAKHQAPPSDELQKRMQSEGEIPFIVVPQR